MVEPDLKTFEVVLHQNHYAKNLKTIDHIDLQGLDDDELVSTVLRGPYLSLVGGIAGLIITRGDVAIL
eukprot:6541336-Heterocapsa_arctica.AAC.1